jgi:hypothetical protein
MSRTECIIDIHVNATDELVNKSWIITLFARIEAEVLE